MAKSACGTRSRFVGGAPGLSGIAGRLPWHEVRIKSDAFPQANPGEHVGEVVQFVPKSDLERARLIREARAIYDSIFPPADRVSEQQEPDEPHGVQG